MKSRATVKTGTGKQTPDQDPQVLHYLVSTRDVDTEHSQMVLIHSSVIKCPCDSFPKFLPLTIQIHYDKKCTWA